MSYEIICPYCFNSMRDDQVLFRSERANRGEPNILPEDVDSIEDFVARYRGEDKEEILSKYRDWEFFMASEDPTYEDFWKRFNGTTEYNPAYKLLGVEDFHRRVIDPENEVHQRYIRMQADGTYYIRDKMGMVSQIELTTGERCERRVCRYCHNPLPANYGKNRVRFVAVVGITGAGKTVYLSQLLYKMKTYAQKSGLTAIPLGPSASNFRDTNVVAARKALPGSTPPDKFQQPLFYEMVRTKDGNGDEKETETFVLYDVAGEVFTDAALVNKFAPFVEHAHGVLVLIDPMQFEVISSVAQTEEQKLNEPAKVLNIIHNIVTHGNTTEKCTTPFAICITKADQSEVQQVFSTRLRDLLLSDVHGIRGDDGFTQAIFNAKEYNPILDELTVFFQENEENLAQHLHTNYADYAYFAFTALGCKVLQEGGYQTPEGPVLPKRIEEPLLWLFHELGYTTANEPIHYPSNQCCPVCGLYKSYNLVQDERQIKYRYMLVRQATLEVKWGCRNCSTKWGDDGYASPDGRVVRY